MTINLKFWTWFTSYKTKLQERAVKLMNLADANNDGKFTSADFQLIVGHVEHWSKNELLPGLEKAAAILEYLKNSLWFAGDKKFNHIAWTIIVDLAYQYFQTTKK